MNNECKVCHQQIQQMCRKGTGLCGEVCQKQATVAGLKRGSKRKTIGLRAKGSENLTSSRG